MNLFPSLFFVACTKTFLPLIPRRTQFMEDNADEFEIVDSDGEEGPDENPTEEEASENEVTSRSDEFSYDEITISSDDFSYLSCDEERRDEFGPPSSVFLNGNSFLEDVPRERMSL